MRLDITGDADSTGFRIKRGKFRARSRNYQRNSQHQDLPIKKLEIFFYRLIFFSLAGHILLSFLIWNGIFRFCLSMILLVILDLCIYGAFACFLDKEFRRWHACEHKVIHLINKTPDLTLENLRKMKRLHGNCGSLLFALITLTLLGEYLLLTLTGGIINYLWDIVCIVCLAGFLSFFGLGLLSQYLLFTAEPTEEQLKEALRVAKEFVEKLNTGGIK